VLLYRWFPPIDVWTGLSLLAVAIVEAGWAFYVRAKITKGNRRRARLAASAGGGAVGVDREGVGVGWRAGGWWIACWFIFCRAAAR